MGDTCLRYIWHDTAIQAALRFWCDPENDETVVLAHTAALRDECHVVAEGDVVKTYTAGEKRVAEAIADLRGSFTVADVRGRLPGGPNSRIVSRQLAALAEPGHLNRTETPNGVADEFHDWLARETGATTVGAAIFRRPLVKKAAFRGSTTHSLRISNSTNVSSMLSKLVTLTFGRSSKWL
ncbi:hypothetical protein RYH80_19845 [Halobaculum sp. MBLA0147]|uniref:hypothetical protein n=1 Tax=Halobaculum sp. MBLA0147 TaxID=3079934 RepID=UPI003525D348